MLDRRDFLRTGAGAILLPASACRRRLGKPLKPEAVLGGLRRESGPTPIPDAQWFVAEEVGDGLDYRFAPGTLASARYLVADMLLDGNHLIVFTITLQEGEKGRAFHFRFGGLNQCGLRMRLPLSLVDQNRWGIDREGAFLKPRCAGDRVDLAKVDRLTFRVSRKSPLPARWCMTELMYSAGEVEKLAQPALPKGPLLDELGQSTLHEWPAKTRSVAELQERLRAQLAEAPKQAWPESFSRWGGWKARRLMKPPGFFRTHYDGKRWWLVDPDGYAFWSAGLDCVRVDTMARYDGLESALTWLPDAAGEFEDAHSIREGREGKFINYLAANFIRTFGSEAWRENWAAIALAELRRLRFNTVGNWSEWDYARRAQLPYVRPMHFAPKRVPRIFRDFPDVYHPDFEKDAADYASQLADTASDPAFLGYFLMNEPEWGFSSELPAAGMLYVTPSCETRNELVRYLKTRYPDEAALAQAWGEGVTFDRVGQGPWNGPFTEAALKDLEAFSIRMTTRYFQVLSEACRKVDPNHLNLGMRWAGTPPTWAVEGMKSFDVFSMNCYRPRVPADVTRKIHELLKMPIIIGEWHFGALDVGLPASGIGHLRNQQERAKAYRIYLEDAAANPVCVGAHWFTLYDQSALGRFDGENYNIGFLDVCNRPYEELCAAAILSHERLYDVAAGRAKPFEEALEYLPNLY